MKCLQKKYNKLEGKCKSAVRNFTAMAMANPTLDFSLVKACEPMIQLFCPVNFGSIFQKKIHYFLFCFEIEY